MLICPFPILTLFHSILLLYALKASLPVQALDSVVFLSSFHYVLHQVGAPLAVIAALEEAIAVWWPHPLRQSDLDSLKQFSMRGSIGVIDDLDLEQLALPHPLFERNRQEAEASKMRREDEIAKQQADAVMLLKSSLQAREDADKALLRALAGARNVGLANAGKNLCATNSLLQVLSRVPEFEQGVAAAVLVAANRPTAAGAPDSQADRATIFVQRLAALLAELRRPAGGAATTAVTAEPVAEMLGTVGQQHDPQELLAKVQDYLEQADAELNATFQSLFTGAKWSLQVVDQRLVDLNADAEDGISLLRTRSGGQMVCPAAHANTPLLAIPINPSRERTAGDAVEAMLRWEMTDEGSKSVKWKRDLLRRLPPNLFFFNEANRGGGQIGSLHFELEETLDLSSYLGRSAMVAATDPAVYAEVKLEQEAVTAEKLLESLSRLTPSVTAATRQASGHLEKARAGLQGVAETLKEWTASVDQQRFAAAERSKSVSLPPTESVVYGLVGLIIYMGTGGVGHYWCYTLDSTLDSTAATSTAAKTEWVRYEDESVRVVGDFRELLSELAATRLNCNPGTAVLEACLMYRRQGDGAGRPACAVGEWPVDLLVDPVSQLAAEPAPEPATPFGAHSTPAGDAPLFRSQSAELAAAIAMSMQSPLASRRGSAQPPVPPAASPPNEPLFPTGFTYEDLPAMSHDDMAGQADVMAGRLPTAEALAGLVQQLVEVTGCSVDQAQTCLDAADGDINLAGAMLQLDG